MGVNMNSTPHGETGLHWAAYGGQRNIVKLLLERRSPLALKDKTFDGTPLAWALYGWAHPPEATGGRYYEVAALLVAAGAPVEPEFLADEKVRSDSTMLVALRGEPSRQQKTNL
jgi:ankyrin repeat protein